MKRLILAFALAAGLAGCSLSPEEETAIRDAAVEVAIGFIEEAKAAGIDPVQLPADRIRLIAAACRAADTFLPILEAYIAAKNAADPEFKPIDFRGYVASACAVALAIISEKPEAPAEGEPA